MCKKINYYLFTIEYFRILHNLLSVLLYQFPAQSYPITFHTRNRYSDFTLFYEFLRKEMPPY